MTGTDASLPNKVPGFSLHDEFVSLRNAGMTSSEILCASTVVPSEWMATNAGIIAPEKKANLVLLDKNPLEDIRNTTLINAVILNGKILDRTILDKILASVRDANNNSRTIDISEFLD